MWFLLVTRWFLSDSYKMYSNHQTIAALNGLPISLLVEVKHNCGLIDGLIYVNLKSISSRLQRTHTEISVPSVVFKVSGVS